MCERASQERDQTTKLEQVLNDLVVGEEGGGGGVKKFEQANLFKNSNSCTVAQGRGNVVVFHCSCSRSKALVCTMFLLCLSIYALTLVVLHALYDYSQHSFTLNLLFINPLFP